MLRRTSSIGGLLAGLLMLAGGFATSASAECAAKDSFGRCVGGVQAPSVSPISEGQQSGGGGSGVDTCKAVLPNTATQTVLHEERGTTPEEGHYYYCTTGLTALLQFSGNPPPPDPAVLAANARAKLTFEAVEIGIAPKPGNRSLVGLPVWMWAENPQAKHFGDVSASASDRGVWVRIDGKVDKVVWDMGDGKTVTCLKGKKYQAQFEDQMSPNCGYRYLKKGTHTVTATSHWTFNTTSNVGFANTENVTVQRTTSVNIDEAQAVRQ